MFTEKELAALVPCEIFERGEAYYYEDHAVGRIQQQGDVFMGKEQATDLPAKSRK